MPIIDSVTVRYESNAACRYVSRRGMFFDRADISRDRSLLRTAAIIPFALRKIRNKRNIRDPYLSRYYVGRYIKKGTVKYL